MPGDSGVSWLRQRPVASGAAVATPIFDKDRSIVAAYKLKPGPIGVRDLGQLAHDKRMRVLAASQIAGIALENANLGQGFLTYALAIDGLNKLKADWHPKDNSIMLGEWMAFGVNRVPQLLGEVHRGSMISPNLENCLNEIALVLSC
jgi:hypothetical protein